MKYWDFTLSKSSYLHPLAVKILGSLSTRVFETRTATGKEHFACEDSGVSQIFILIISNAPINVFPDPVEGGHTRAFDLSSQSVGGDFGFI